MKFIEKLPYDDWFVYDNLSINTIFLVVYNLYHGCLCLWMCNNHLNNNKIFYMMEVCLWIRLHVAEDWLTNVCGKMNRLVDILSDCTAVWLFEWLIVWLSDCLTVWLSDCLTVWLSDSCSYREQINWCSIHYWIKHIYLLKLWFWVSLFKYSFCSCFQVWFLCLA